MRLQVLDKGHGVGTKMLFALIRTASRQPVLDVVKLVRYRSDFYGGPMSEITQEAMRGPSSWSVGDRELMAACIAETNHSEFCTKAHSAVAARAYGDNKKVSETLSNLDTAHVGEPLRSTLLLLRKVTRNQIVKVDDIREVLNAGATPQQVKDALAICYSFNIISRLADAFGFSVPSREAFEAGAKYLLARGYR
jgi:alkylhydroperoxidase family enzyme